MDQKRLEACYLEQDHNCAESILLEASEVWHLGLTQEEVKLASGFGGGLGCGKTCGALCACVAMLGRLFVDGRAHATQGFRELCGDFVRRYEAAFGDTDCEGLKARHAVEGKRCLTLVESSMELLEDYVRQRID
ncbi:MAG: C-GCAxxG-C-C family protein [Clostridia bacterium]|nr:C-GCAxxG-C-C family protein [Clostridia bacterium]